MRFAPWVIMCVLMPACGRDAEDATKAAPVAPAPADDLAEKLRHCPLTVPQATSEVTDVEGGVRLTVRAEGDARVAEVRRRARHLVEFTAGRVAKDAHGAGKGGGFMRNCPIVTKDTRVSAQDVDGGSALTVTALDAATVDVLRAETRSRMDRLEVPAR